MKTVKPNETAPGKLETVSEFTRILLGWSLGAAFMFSAFALVITTGVIAAKVNDPGGSWLDTMGACVVASILAALLTGGGAAAFRWAGHKAAAHGPLYLGVLLCFGGMTSLASGDKAELVWLVGTPMVIWGIIVISLGLIAHRRARAAGVDVINLGRARFSYDDTYVKSHIYTGTVDRLQTPMKRRFIVSAYVMMSILIFAALLLWDGYVNSDISEWIAIAVYAAVLLLICCAHYFLNLTLRPISILAGETHDERQLQIINEAHADSRIVTLGLIAFLGCIAVFGAPTLVTVFVAIWVFWMASIAPKLIAAWTLPAEDNNISDATDDAAFLRNLSMK